MSEPPPPPPAPPLPLAPAPSADAEPWQRRMELLAVLLVVAVVVILVSALVAANAQVSETATSFPGGARGGFDLAEVVRVGGSSANLAVAGALLVALLLVTLGPGDRIGRQGTTVLRSVAVVGLLSAGLAAISGVLTVVDPPDQATFSTGPTGFVGDGLIARLSQVAPLLVAAILAGYVAWCAFSTLGEVPPEPVVADDQPDAT